jgi:RNA polymerase sigma-70 factor (ECF subfamily)
LDTHLPLSDYRPAAANTDREPLDVAALTRRMVAGDETAYRIFYDAYFDRLWRYLIVVTSGNEDTAREALQATLTRLVRHIRVFSSEPVFWSWLTVLARSALTDQTRKRRRYLAFLDRFSQHAATANTADDDNRADERLRQLLDHHITSLAADERQLVEAKYFAHRSVRDLAAEMQITEKAVESRLTRIRHKLKSAVLAALKNESSD